MFTPGATASSDEASSDDEPAATVLPTLAVIDDDPGPDTRLPRHQTGQVSNFSTYVDLPGACSNFAPRVKSLVSEVTVIRRRQPRGAGVRASADARGELAAESAHVIGALVTGLRQRAALRYQAGETLRQIAKDLGVGRERLGAVLRADGVQTRRRPIPSAAVPELVRRYQAGESLATLGARFGWSPGTIRARLLDAGVAMRDQHGRSVVVVPR